MIFEILFFFEFAFYQVYNFNFCKVWETCAKVYWTDVLLVSEILEILSWFVFYTNREIYLENLCAEIRIFV